MITFTLKVKYLVRHVQRRIVNIGRRMLKLERPGRRLGEKPKQGIDGCIEGGHEVS